MNQNEIFCIEKIASLQLGILTEDLILDLN